MHVRCPHCHNPTEVVEDASLSDLTCPSCGSSFSLLGGDTTGSYHAEPKRMIGHFRLESKLGAGAFGTVWMAKDTELDRSVAVKVPRKGQLDAHETEIFFREARAAAQLRHPNIVSVHEVGRDGDSVYIVSDLIDGMSLSDWLSGQRVTIREAVRLCLKISEALEHAHEHGVVHRDLKPSNVVLGSDGEPHIMDFGLAKREAGEITMTMEGQVLGTPAYMSPEQAQGESHRGDRRSDVYSLGVMFFELLTGELPFRGNKRMLLHQVIHDEPPSPRKLNAIVPRDLETICLKCLEKEPRRRFKTAQDLVDEFRCFLDGKPVRSRPVSPLMKTWRWCRRNPLAAALIGLLSFFAIISPPVALQQISLRDRADNALVLAKKGQATAQLERTVAERARDLARNSERRLRRQLYNSDLILGMQAWSNGNLPYTLDLLKKYDTDINGGEDLRSFGWYYLWRLTHGHQFSVDQAGPIAFSHDGEKLTVVAKDDTHVYDLANGKIVQSVPRPNSPASGVISNDLTTLAQISGTNIKLFDLHTGTERVTLLGSSASIKSLQISRDGNRIAASSRDGILRVWNSSESEPYQTIKCPVTSYEQIPIAISPDGLTVAYPATSRVIMLDRLDDELPAVSLGRSLKPLLLEFSPDGKTLAVGQRKNIVLLDLNNGEEIGQIAEDINTGNSLVFSQDGQHLLVLGMDRAAQLWDLETQQLATSVPGSKRGGFVALSPDNGLIAVSSKPAYSTRTTVWSVRDAVEKTVPSALVVPSAQFGGIKTVAFMDPSTVLTLSHGSQVQVRDAITGEGLLHNIYQRVDGGFAAATAVFSDGGVYITGHAAGQIRVWDIASGELRHEWKGHTDTVRSLALSHDGKFLASASRDGTAKLWDPSTGTIYATLDRHPQSVYTVCFAEDDSTLITIVQSGNLESWRYRESPTSIPQLNLKDSVGNANAMVLSPDEKLAAVGHFGGSITLIDMKERTVRSHFQAHADTVTSLSFSPDGETLASGGLDGTVKLWDPLIGVERMTLKGHPHGVLTVAFSPDGRMLASGCNGGMLRIWKAALDSDLGGDSAHEVGGTGSSDSPLSTTRLTPSEKEMKGSRMKADDLSIEAGTGGDVNIVAIRDLGGRVVFDGHDQNRQIVSVTLRGSDVTDRELNRLSDLTTLQELNLLGTGITGVGLEKLTQLTKLRALSVFRTDVNSAGLAHISRMTSLQQLVLADTLVDDEGMVFLGAMTNLHTLNLGSTAVTDAGLERIGTLPKLRSLGLSYTEISDRGLAHLTKLTNLERLNVSKTQVTQLGVDTLRSELPKCLIYK